VQRIVLIVTASADDAQRVQGIWDLHQQATKKITGVKWRGSAFGSGPAESCTGSTWNTHAAMELQAPSQIIAPPQESARVDFVETLR